MNDSSNEGAQQTFLWKVTKEKNINLQSSSNEGHNIVLCRRTSNLSSDIRVVYSFCNTCPKIWVRSAAAKSVDQSIRESSQIGESL